MKLGSFWLWAASHRAPRRRAHDLRPRTGQRLHLLRGLCRAAICGARHGLEHHGRVHGLCELRHGRVLCRGCLHIRGALQPLQGAAAGDDPGIGNCLRAPRPRHGLPHSAAAGRLLRDCDACARHRPRDPRRQLGLCGRRDRRLHPAGPGDCTVRRLHRVPVLRDASPRDLRRRGPRAGSSARRPGAASLRSATTRRQPSVRACRR